MTEPSSPTDPMSAPVRDWLIGHHQAVLITLKRDGSAQSSNISYSFDGTRVRISVTSGRAKTHNIRRDPRVVLHVLGDTFWQFAAVQADAELGAVSTVPGDAAGRELLDLYETLAGPHPDHDEYLQAMVDDARLVLTLTPTRVTTANID